MSLLQYKAYYIHKGIHKGMKFTETSKEAMNVITLRITFYILNLNDYSCRSVLPRRNRFLVL